MTTLNQIRNIVDKGYIDDPVKVAQITDEFANLQMKEIFKCDSQEVRELFDALAQLYDFYPAVLDELTYVEILTLINDLEQVMEPTVDLSADQFKRFHIVFLKRIMLAAGKTNPVVKLFLATEISSLMKYLKSRHQKSEVGLHESSLFFDYRELLKEYDDDQDSGNHLKSKITVSDLLQLTTNECSKSWACWTDIDKYKFRVLTASDIDMRLLLKVFIEAYREHAVIDTIFQDHPTFSLEFIPPPDDLIFDDDIEEIED